MPNDLLAQLAQIERIDYVKQSNAGEPRPVDGLRVYAGNDDLFARTLDLGEPAGSSSRATSSARRCAGWSRSPSTARRSTPRSQDVYQTLFLTANPTCTKAALELLGHHVGGLRLPMVDADEAEREAVRAMLGPPRPAGACDA